MQSIHTKKAVMVPACEPASPEFRALADKQHEENWEPFIDDINAKLIEAQTLREAEERKVRERTLNSSQMGQEVLT